jgi:hypothetical protein
MTPDQVKTQTQQAYKQWCVQWRANATHHSKHKMKPMGELIHSGVGKAIVLVANGYSFEEQLETLKKHKRNVDIMCCDKTLGHLLANGITPDFCMVADANVDYEKYMAPYKDQLENTILLMNVCGNTKWSDNGNWKDKYFFVFKDVMQYEKEFCQLSGCTNIVTAGTNVSNMMVVICTQSDNEHPGRNLFGYDKIILVGFDYSWRYDGKYYAFDQDGGGKHHYMRHIYGLSPSGKMIYSSNNLSTSASWLEMYIKTFNLPVVQTSEHSLLRLTGHRKLEDNIKHRYKTSDRDEVRNLVVQKNHLAQQMAKIDGKLVKIAKDHRLAHLSTV